MSKWLGSLFLARPKSSPEQARQLLDGGAILLDVRQDAEWRAGHAPGAQHIPLGRLPARIKDLAPQRTVITVCRSGHRSAGAAALLARQGRDVVNLPAECAPGREPGCPWSPPEAAAAGSCELAVLIVIVAGYTLTRSPIACRDTRLPYTPQGIVASVTARGDGL
jgi:rhodanese-related sulfurtransferase